ncbi:MAG: hypothetical protein R6U30_15615 [Halomonas sp.]
MPLSPRASNKKWRRAEVTREIALERDAQALSSYLIMAGLRTLMKSGGW